MQLRDQKSSTWPIYPHRRTFRKRDAVQIHNNGAAHDGHAVRQLSSASGHHVPPARARCCQEHEPTQGAESALISAQEHAAARLKSGQHSAQLPATPAVAGAVVDGTSRAMGGGFCARVSLGPKAPAGMPCRCRTSEHRLRARPKARGMWASSPRMCSQPAFLCKRASPWVATRCCQTRA